MSSVASHEMRVEHPEEIKGNMNPCEMHADNIEGLEGKTRQVSLQEITDHVEDLEENAKEPSFKEIVDTIVDPEKNTQARDVCKPEAKNMPARELSARDTIMTILPAAAGSFVEWYDFAIYSYVSKYITANFFDDGFGGSVGTWAGFAVTFLFRPLGGVVFGFLADTVGRKRAMQITIGMMLATSTLQGALPSFVWPGGNWGYAGAALLLTSRALQGLSAGGELATAAVYISEVSPKHNLGFNLSWLSVFGSFGSWVVASMIVYALEIVLSEDDMKTYGWRIPYYLALAPGLLIMYGRSQLSESSDFEEHVHAMESKNGPLREVITNHKMGLIVASFGSACVGAFWFVPTFYGPEFLQALHPSIENTAVTLSEGIVFLIPAVCAPLVGMLVDVVGAGKVYLVTVILCGIALPVPLFLWWGHLSEGDASEGMYIGEVIVGLCCALTTSTYAWIVEFFPVEVRVTGVSVAYNIGVGLFGGFGPLLSASLKGPLAPKSALPAPAAVTLFCGVLSLAALILGWVLSRRGMLRLNHIRESPY